MKADAVPKGRKSLVGQIKIDPKQARSQLQGRIDGPLLMVFQCHWRPEDRLDFVADKLQHQAMMGVDGLGSWI
jgi:hypothetical protein